MLRRARHVIRAGLYVLKNCQPLVEEKELGGTVTSPDWTEDIQKKGKYKGLKSIYWGEVNPNTKFTPG